ncbi:MAG: hypothetical protein KDJ15_02425 [Alphaproteobacteria bacterium]|nr:hypothetical protein [Alphaproteobacteria bacterium]
MTPIEKAGQALKALSIQDWQMFGHDQVAYIRPIHGSDGAVCAYALHDADGTCLETGANIDELIFVAARKEMTAVMAQ